MKQLYVMGQGDVRLIEVPPPPCGDGDVLVEVAACGICGSDLGYIRSGGVAGPGGPPMPLGHEFAGRISAVGAQAGDWAVGQAVVVNPLSAANMIGNGGADGAFAPTVRVRAARAPGTLYALPASVPLEHGALAEPLAVAFNAVAQSGAGPHTRAVVLGAGPIGLGCVIGLKRAGAPDVVVVERSAHRREIALRLGADIACADLDEGFWQAAVARHGSVPFYGAALPGTELFIECSGAPALAQAVVQRAAPRAHLTLVAVYKQPVALDLTLVMAKELRLQGVLSYGDSFAAAIDHLARHGEAIAPYVSHRLPLSRITEALALAGDAERSAKVLVLPD